MFSTSIAAAIPESARCHGTYSCVGVTNVTLRRAGGLNSPARVRRRRQRLGGPGGPFLLGRCPGARLEAGGGSYEGSWLCTGAWPWLDFIPDPERICVGSAGRAA